MKITKFLNKKTIAILAVALFATGAAVGTTVAYLKDTTDTLTNTFEVGSVETELLEVVSGTTKQPYVMNTGKNDCYVRIRATVSPSDLLLQDAVDGFDENRWEHIGEYYYYKKVVKPGEITEAPLFNNIQQDEKTKGKDFSIILYQEAVQTSVATPDGVETDMMKIWKFYEAQNESNN